MVYHDLRSPLANITSSLDLLDALLPAENSEDTRQVFEIAQRAVARLQRMINSCWISTGWNPTEPGELNPARYQRLDS
jgi:K+-sensing histidine kinase KdpD